MGRPQDPPVLGFDELAEVAAMEHQQVVGSVADLPEEAGDVLHITAHGVKRYDWHAALQIGPGADDVRDADTLRDLDLRPGSLVTLAACSAAGGIDADIPPDLPAAAIQSGAGAVLYARYPVSSRELHAGLAELYSQLPFDCRELAERWHRIRADGPRSLLGVEVLLSSRCLPG